MPFHVSYKMPQPIGSIDIFLDDQWAQELKVLTARDRAHFLHGLFAALRADGTLDLQKSIYIHRVKPIQDLSTNTMRYKVGLVTPLMTSIKRLDQWDAKLDTHELEKDVVKSYAQADEKRMALFLNPLKEQIKFGKSLLTELETASPKKPADRPATPPSDNPYAAITVQREEDAEPESPIQAPDEPEEKLNLIALKRSLVEALRNAAKQYRDSLIRGLKPEDINSKNDALSKKLASLNNKFQGSAFAYFEENEVKLSHPHIVGNLELHDLVELVNDTLKRTDSATVGSSESLTFLQAELAKLKSQNFKFTERSFTTKPSFSLTQSGEDIANAETEIREINRKTKTEIDAKAKEPAILDAKRKEHAEREARKLAVKNKSDAKVAEEKELKEKITALTKQLERPESEMTEAKSYEFTTELATVLPKETLANWEEYKILSDNLLKANDEVLNPKSVAALSLDVAKHAITTITPRLAALARNLPHPSLLDAYDKIVKQYDKIAERRQLPTRAQLDVIRANREAKKQLEADHIAKAQQLADATQALAKEAKQLLESKPFDDKQAADVQARIHKLNDDPIYTAPIRARFTRDNQPIIQELAGTLRKVNAAIKLAEEANALNEEIVALTDRTKKSMSEYKETENPNAAESALEESKKNREALITRLTSLQQKVKTTTVDLSALNNNLHRAEETEKSFAQFKKDKETEKLHAEIAAKKAKEEAEQLAAQKAREEEEAAKLAAEKERAEKIATEAAAKLAAETEAKNAANALQAAKAAEADAKKQATLHPPKSATPSPEPSPQPSPNMPKREAPPMMRLRIPASMSPFYSHSPSLSTRAASPTPSLEKAPGSPSPSPSPNSLLSKVGQFSKTTDKSILGQTKSERLAAAKHVMTLIENYVKPKLGKLERKKENKTSLLITPEKAWEAFLNYATDKELTTFNEQYLATILEGTAKGLGSLLKSFCGIKVAHDANKVLALLGIYHYAAAMLLDPNDENTTALNQQVLKTIEHFGKNKQVKDLYTSSFSGAGNYASQVLPNIGAALLIPKPEIDALMNPPTQAYVSTVGAKNLL